MSNINQLATKVLAEHGIMKGVKVEQTPQRGPARKPSFEAFTDLTSNQTTMRYDPTFSIPSSARNFAYAKNIQNNPHFGGTQMDTQAIDSLFEGGKSVFFTVSDGDIQNWNSVKTSFIQQARQHHYFHIQLGAHTDMTKDLKGAGLPVYTVKTGVELERLAIDLTRNAYQSHINDVMEHLP